MKKLKALLVGYGYWGPNLARNLNNIEQFEFKSIFEIDLDIYPQIQIDYPDATVYSSLNEIGSDYDCVFISTPATTHFDLAKHFLNLGANVFVEKPLTTKSEDSKALIDLASKNNLKLMVGHTYLHHPAVLKIRELINSGFIGDIYGVHSERLNLGQIRQDINVMWNLAPHDISIICYLLGEYPKEIEAIGSRHINDSVEDIVYIDLKFENGAKGFVHNSWLHPLKSRKVIVTGSKGMILFDDTKNNQLLHYEKGINWDKYQKNEKGKNSRFELIDGDVLTLDFERIEPLKSEILAFANWIIDGNKPLSDCQNGHEIVKILEKAQSQLV